MMECKLFKTNFLLSAFVAILFLSVSTFSNASLLTINHSNAGSFSLTQNSFSTSSNTSSFESDFFTGIFFEQFDSNLGVLQQVNLQIEANYSVRAQLNSQNNGTGGPNDLLNSSAVSSQADFGFNISETNFETGHMSNSALSTCINTSALCTAENTIVGDFTLTHTLAANDTFIGNGSTFDRWFLGYNGPLTTSILFCDGPSTLCGVRGAYKLSYDVTIDYLYELQTNAVNEPAIGAFAFAMLLLVRARKSF